MNTKECKTLTETKDVLNRWHEYGKELFDATQQQKSTDIPCLDRHSIEPSPLIIEVEAAVKELKQEKSPGLDCIPAGLLKNCGVSGMKARHHLCCAICTTCE